MSGEGANTVVVVMIEVGVGLVADPGFEPGLEDF